MTALLAQQVGTLGDMRAKSGWSVAVRAFQHGLDWP